MSSLGPGGTNSGWTAFHGGTDGEFSSEVVADADVRAGVARFSTSSSSSTVLNIKSARGRLVLIPSSRAASRTDARSAFESRLCEESRRLRRGRDPTTAMTR